MEKRRFILGDPHFGHENIIKYCNRPFKDIEEMNETLISNWNSVVNAQDRIYLCGDIAMNKKYIPLVSKLNGHKVLIKGNHDIFPLDHYLPYFDDIRSYVVENGIIISHIPVLLNPYERYIGNIHGHTHETDVPDPRYFNISADKINFTPILLEEAKDLLYKQISDDK